MLQLECITNRKRSCFEAYTSLHSPPQQSYICILYKREYDGFQRRKCSLNVFSTKLLQDLSFASYMILLFCIQSQKYTIAYNAKGLFLKVYRLFKLSTEYTAQSLIQICGFQKSGKCRQKARKLSKLPVPSRRKLQHYSPASHLH